MFTYNNLLSINKYKIKQFFSVIIVTPLLFLIKATLCVVLKNQHIVVFSLFSTLQYLHLSTD